MCLQLSVAGLLTTTPLHPSFKYINLILGRVNDGLHLSYNEIALLRIASALYLELCCGWFYSITTYYIVD